MVTDRQTDRTTTVPLVHALRVKNELTSIYIIVYQAEKIDVEMERIKSKANLQSYMRHAHTNSHTLTVIYSHTHSHTHTQGSQPYILHAVAQKQMHV